MKILKYKDGQGNWVSVPALIGPKGDKGDDGEKGDKGDRGDTVIIASKYSELTFPVAEGTYCLYNDVPYVANQAISTSEAWTAAHWDQVSFEDEIGELKNAINSLDETIHGKDESTQNVTSSLTWTDGRGVDSRNGNPSAESGYSYTDVPLSTANVVSGYTRAGQELLKGLAFLDGNGGYISGDANIGSGTYDWYYNLDIPEGATILRISCNTSYKSSFTCYLTFNEIPGIDDRVEKLEKEIGIVEEDTWLKVDNFEVGTLYVDNGELKTSSSDVRVRTKTTANIQLKKNDALGLSSYSHYKFMMFMSSDGETWSHGEWLTSNYTVPSDGYYCFIIEDTNNTTQTSPDALFSLIIYKSTKPETFAQEINRKINTLDHDIKTAKFAHLSFDDVQYCFLDLQTNENTYTSIFDNDFFAMLKELHEKYGTVVSLYMFITNSGTGIAGYPTKFSAEFAKNADWLKFGLHHTFTGNIVNIAGTADAIDRCPRLGNFKGNSASMVAMRDADAGIVGLLSAYDNRDSYYLSSADSAYVFSHGRLYDTANRLTFFRSLYAIEALDPTTILPALLTLAGTNGSDYAILMMHEYGVYGSDYQIVTSMKNRLEYACNWAKENGYVWDFPMNRILR